MFDLDVQPQDSCRARSFWAHNLSEMGDPRNRSSAVNRRSVHKDRETTGLGVSGKIGEVGERELVPVVNVKCGKERDMTRG